MHPDLLIIGAGVVGLSSALELAKRGARITVLERRHAGAESTWAGAGILSPLLPWHYDDSVNLLSEWSRRLFRDWCASLQDSSGVDPEYRPTGMLVLAPPDVSAAIDWCRQQDWRCVETTSGAWLPADADVDALWLPDVAQVRNPRLISALRGAVKAMGVNLVEDVEVAGLESQDGRVKALITSRGLFASDTYVVCAGAWSGSLPGLEPFVERIHPVKGQMLLYRLPAGRLESIIYDNGRYLVPRADGHLLVGSTLEYVGFERSLTDAAREKLSAFAARLLPELQGVQPQRQWSGLRPGSPGNRPLIDRYPRFENLFINSGHFRYGVTMAPASAKMLASLVYGEVPPIPTGSYGFGWS